MVTHKEYRICMPVSVEEYRIGQLFMIAKHCHEQSEAGDGVEVVKNEVCVDEEHGQGQYTEKRIHISSKLPVWARALVSQYLYVEEKAWNYYPYTITEYYPLSLGDDVLAKREVLHLDIAHDPIDAKKYKEEEDCRLFKSAKTGRGPLTDKAWRETSAPIMCSYKLVSATCSVFGIGGYLESAAHATIKDILLHGHRQAFCWIDEWFGMGMEDVRAFEEQKQIETNKITLGDNDDSAIEGAGADGSATGC